MTDEQIDVLKNRILDIIHASTYQGNASGRVKYEAGFFDPAQFEVELKKELSTKRVVFHDETVREAVILHALTLNIVPSRTFVKDVDFTIDSQGKVKSTLAVKAPFIKITRD